MLNDILDAWKIWAQARGTKKEKISTYLDTIAEEASQLADKVGELAGALEKGDESAGELLYAHICQHCGAIQGLYKGCSGVIGGREHTLNESTVYRLACILMTPVMLTGQLNHQLVGGPGVLAGVGLGNWPTHSPAEIRTAILKLHEEAGALRAVAATYRAAS